MKMSVYKDMVKKLTYMSWTNEYYGQYYRAIALVEADGYFQEAINCLRDSDMGETDENRVFSRHWYDDYIQNDEHLDLRPASSYEIALYKQYVKVPVDSVECLGYLTSEVYIVSEKKPLFRRILNHLRCLIF